MGAKICEKKKNYLYEIRERNFSHLTNLQVKVMPLSIYLVRASNKKFQKNFCLSDEI